MTILTLPSRPARPRGLFRPQAYVVRFPVQARPLRAEPIRRQSFGSTTVVRHWATAEDARACRLCKTGCNAYVSFRATLPDTGAVCQVEVPDACLSGDLHMFACDSPGQHYKGDSSLPDRLQYVRPSQ